MGKQTEQRPLSNLCISHVNHFNRTASFPMQSNVGPTIMRGFLSLPNELLLDIIAYLPVRTTLDLARVNKRFRDVTRVAIYQAVDLTALKKLCLRLKLNEFPRLRGDITAYGYVAVDQNGHIMGMDYEDIIQFPRLRRLQLMTFQTLLEAFRSMAKELSQERHDNEIRKALRDFTVGNFNIAIVGQYYQELDNEAQALQSSASDLHSILCEDVANGLTEIDIEALYSLPVPVLFSLAQKPRVGRVRVSDLREPHDSMLIDGTSIRLQKNKVKTLELSGHRWGCWGSMKGPWFPLQCLESLLSNSPYLKTLACIHLCLNRDNLLRDKYILDRTAIGHALRHVAETLKSLTLTLPAFGFGRRYQAALSVPTEQQPFPTLTRKVTILGNYLSFSTFPVLTHLHIDTAYIIVPPESSTIGFDPMQMTRLFRLMPPRLEELQCLLPSRLIFQPTSPSSTISMENSTWALPSHPPNTTSSTSSPPTPPSTSLACTLSSSPRQSCFSSKFLSNTANSADPKCTPSSLGSCLRSFTKYIPRQESSCSSVCGNGTRISTNRPAWIVGGTLSGALQRILSESETGILRPSLLQIFRFWRYFHLRS
ncbi:hypothetical protein M011DRAFT_41666 [Sporormia fimetaria CBS 119925]|uniref:F-box domain-containing protein n=1 Tax=Sporormia fimetaria CBS 119925 TaxID=1340428 RepID=A0A6A6VCG6_9PLEO|nr:hypothetical protein M011DRAFT_41666 [Sporormia fimetaria CBS 119925]